MSKLSRNSRAGRLKLAGFVAAFVLVGVGVVWMSRAAGVPIAFEAEQGSVVGPAQTTALSGASGGDGVRFAGASTDPCANFPALPAVRPEATNTGVPGGITLTNYTGSTDITTAGTVIDGKIITSQLNIKANNVTIQNSKLGPGGYWAILVDDNITGTKVLHSEIYAPNGGYTGIGMSDGIICGSHIHGYENAITIGGNMTIQANYIHGLKGDGSSDPHYDAIEVYSGSNSKIWGNSLYVNDPNGNWLGDTGAVNITTEWSNIDNVHVNGNWLGGGSYTLYVRRSSAASSYRYSNIRITNNRWLGPAPKGYAAYGPVSDDGGLTEFTGNVWDATGQSL